MCTEPVFLIESTSTKSLEPIPEVYPSPVYCVKESGPARRAEEKAGELLLCVRQVRHRGLQSDARESADGEADHQPRAQHQHGIRFPRSFNRHGAKVSNCARHDEGIFTSRDRQPSGRCSSLYSVE